MKYGELPGRDAYKMHFVWITKYRKPVLCGEAAQKVRERVRQVCMANNVEIAMGNVGKVAEFPTKLEGR